MLTPNDIRNPKRKSGFNHVNSAGGKGRGHGGGGQWCANLRGSGAAGTQKRGPRRATALEAAKDYCDYMNKPRDPITIEDIRNSTRKSGFDHVTDSSRTISHRPREGKKPYRAADGKRQPGRTTPIWQGPRRATAEEAAQDYCDYINSQQVAATATLKSAGHEREVIEKARSEEKSKLYARLREIKTEEDADLTHPGYVYLIGEEGSDYAFKIGHARTSAQNRMISLQTGNPRKLVLIGTVEGSPQRESELHAKYAQDNVLQEWFRGSHDLFAEFGASWDSWRFGTLTATAGWVARDARKPVTTW